MKNIVIIDNDRKQVEDISICLSMRWPKAKFYSTGVYGRGIKMVKDEAPDITIINMELPGNDIYQTIREIRSISKEPLIAISGNHDEKELIKAINCGADSFLPKPFSQITLMALANNLMRRRGGLSSTKTD